MSQNSAALRLRVFTITAILAFVAAITMGMAARADAANINVPGSGLAATSQFVSALATANASTGVPDTITFTGTAPVVKPDATLKITDTLTINATNGPGVTFDGTIVIPPGDTLLSVASGVTATIFNSTFTNGGSTGLAAIVDSGTLNLNASTVSGNIGPGVNVKPGATGKFTNTTISDGNDAGVIDRGTASFFNSTVASNASGGIDNAGATLNLTNSIVTDNAFSDCSRHATTSDHSLSTASCGTDITGAANLGDLLDHGGPTTTRSLGAGSAAIGAGNSATCQALDQRYVARRTPCDLGAEESNTVAPTFTGATLTVDATTPTGAVVTFGPQATSAHDVIVSQSCTPASGSTFPIGTTPVNCTATDGHGNVGHGTFNVVVNDPPPVINQPSNVGPIEATGPGGAVATYPAVTTSDPNNGPGTATCTPASGSTFPIGVDTVTCTAPGAAPKTFTVTVRDTTAPVIAPIANKTVDSQSTAGAVVNFTPSVTDAVGGGSATCTPAGGSTFAIGGPTTVTCNAVDGAGNHAAPVSFTVTVVNVITLTPATATNPVGTPHTVTAKVVKAGSPVSGLTITFNVTAGPNTGAHGSSVTNSTGQATFQYVGGPTGGTDTIRASFVDSGELTQAATASKTWFTNLPPVAKLTASPTSGAAALAVVFNGSQSSDPDGTIATWTLNYGDATVIGSGSGTPPASIPHSYVNAGDYTATLTVTDNQGATATATVPIHVTAPTTQLALTPGLLRLSPFGVFLGDLHATLTRTSPATPVAGKVITFTSGGAFVCQATTDVNGSATCGGSGNLLAVILGLGYQASFAGDSQYVASFGSAGLIG